MREAAARSNLSYRIVSALQADFPGSAHIRDFALERADDATIWEFARQRGFTITTKDADFHQRSFVQGHPPKVIWLRIGNCSTSQILDLLLGHVADLLAFEADEATALLVVS